MKIHIYDRTPGQIPVGALVMLPLFSLPLAAWAVQEGHIKTGVCGIKRTLEMPCFSCGSTRATLHLFRGELFAAISMQPMMMFVYFCLFLWGSISLISFARNKQVFLEMSRRQDLTFKLSLLAIPIINWIYLVMTGV